MTGGNGTLGGTIGFSLLPLTVARQTGTTKVFGTVPYLGYLLDLRLASWPPEADHGFSPTIAV
jgi:hypothetical protein